ncbi:MAG: bifunctional glutamate N-acetyltransferase/amino-acid acetyltransferase ArgJ [Pseudomonadales bacterium]|nr:bifunctional glutamate N-acetyltransferase/amino-acid acetyltransferase ArgJ [Pseudomonadales bacterium]
MAVGHKPLPDFAVIKGLKIGVANAGIKQSQRPDVTIFELAENATIAGVYTTNAFCAAPVHICKKHTAEASTRYLLVNTGNANAGTGEAGFATAQECVDALAQKTAVQASQVLPYSTGVIGEPLPASKIIDSLDAALADLSEDHWPAAASAIMTTDTRPKGVTASIKVAGSTLNISGISKGAGMIKPNMATMLSYVALDAKVSQSLLQQLLSEVNAKSFNRITVDGDTSTNDSAMLIATAASDLDVDSLQAADLEKVKAALQGVYIELAQLIIRDGEGANKFVHVKVINAESEKEAESVAYTVAESPLVKTALYASDPNWGRILAAVGRAGVKALQVNKINLLINDVLIAENGGRALSYTEEAGVREFAKEEIIITIDLARGVEQATVWTSDLSIEYVRINAEYRT